MRTIATALLVTLVACGDENGPQLQPAAFQLIEGAAQVDTVGRELKEMVALRVITTDGITAVPNYPINWTALDGGEVFAPVAYSGTDGVARQRWTLGIKAGAQRLVARALDPETGEILVDDTVTAIGTPGEATQIVADFGPNAAHPTEINLLAVGDTGLVAYWYADAWGNAGASCNDGGAPDRVTWSSSDSLAILPLGTTVTLEAYADWYAERGQPIPPYATQVVAQDVREPGITVLGTAPITCVLRDRAGVAFLVR